MPYCRLSGYFFLQISLHGRLGDMINVDFALSFHTKPPFKRLKDTASKQHAAIGLAGYSPRRLTQAIAAFNEGGRIANLLDASLVRFGQ